MIEPSLELTELLVGLVKKAYQGLSGYTDKHDFFNTATKKYLKNIRKDFGHVRVLGMKDLVPLDSLYVRANILEKISARTGDLPEELEKVRKMYFTALSKTVEIVDGEAIVNRADNLLVLGKPGAGKTTYLKYLTLRMASRDKNSNIKRRRLPVFVTLHEYAKSGKTLLDFAAEQFDLCGFENAKPFLERMLGNGDCLVLLDGLDEVSRETQLDKVIQEVKDFTRKYRDSQFVVSCRIASYNHEFEQFKEVEIADFNKEQIEDFVKKYFQKEPAVAKACWERLKSSERLLEMAKSPLLLTLLCITYDERQDFPPNRALLYQRGIDTLLNRWDASRRIQRDKLYKDLDEPRLLNLLSRLAAGAFEENVYFFREDHLKKGIGQFLVDLLGEDARHKSGLVLQDIEQHYGLIVRRSQYAFSFSHLTFLEYFTAQYVVDKALSGSIDGLIENHFGDDRWLEVFLLVAGKLGYGADEFLLKMQRKNRELLDNAPEANLLLDRVINAVADLESKYYVHQRKATALVVALFQMGLALNHADQLESILSDDNSRRGQSFRISRLSIRVKDIERRKKLEEYTRKGKELGKDINLSKLLGVNRLTNPDSLNVFLKGNVWIAKILNSGATVSARVREKILEDLFRPA